MGQREIAARRQRANEAGHDPVGVLVVVDVLQDGHQRDRDRPGEVKQPSRLVQDPACVTQVAVDEGGLAFRAADQQRAGVGQDHRIVVHVDHAGRRGDRLGDLVGVVRGRDAGTDVEELPNAGLGRQVAHRATQERTVRAHGEDQVRIGLESLVARVPVRPGNCPCRPASSRTPWPRGPRRCPVAAVCLLPSGFLPPRAAGASARGITLSGGYPQAGSDACFHTGAINSFSVAEPHNESSYRRKSSMCSLLNRAP